MINANQVCVVTGAGKGIGRGIATVLAREGATVIAASRSAANLRITKEMIETAGGRAAAIPVDITDRPGVQAFVKQVIADFGRIDVLVNNAGLMPMPANLVDFDDQLWENLFRVNTTGTYNMIKAVLPHMMQQEFGRVINMSSVAARLTFPAFAAYGAAKAALHALTTALAKEVAVHKITVNCILPGFTRAPRRWNISGARSPRQPAKHWTNWWTPSWNPKSPSIAGCSRKKSGTWFRFSPAAKRTASPGNSWSWTADWMCTTERFPDMRLSSRQSVAAMARAASLRCQSECRVRRTPTPPLACFAAAAAGETAPDAPTWTPRHR